ncbi:MAG: competence/damage-inducible protein A [Flavobacteriales bacterium]
MLNAILICIGDELLIGQTVNTNAAWMGSALNQHGIRVLESVAIADDPEAIVLAMEHALERASIVLMTGGLGPTKDDLTKHTLARFFNQELCINQEVLARIKAYFESRGLPFLPSNASQAELPAGCRVIHNYRGTASGMWFEHQNRVVVSMPGVPYEMQGMMTDEIIPALCDKFKCPTIVHRTILTTGVGESFLADRIAAWEESLAADEIKLAYLPSPGMVKLRMSVYGGTPHQREVMQRREAELLDMLGDVVYGFDDDTLITVVARRLTEMGATLSAAESCTGGRISYELTSVAGSSAYFLGGVVTYHANLKSALIGVDEGLIREYGVVSREVAMAMASGVKHTCQSDYAISVTGVAGPDSLEGKPVGYLWIGVSTPERTFAQDFQFGRSRQNNISMATWAALNLLRKEIL